MFRSTGAGGCLKLIFSSGFVTLIAALLMVSGSVTANVAEWLETPARESVEDLPAEYVTDEVEAALASKAYLAGLALAGQGAGKRWAIETWEQAQEHAEPHVEFQSLGLARVDDLRATIARAAALMAPTSDAPDQRSASFEPQVLAFRLLIEAEGATVRASNVLAHEHDLQLPSVRLLVGKQIHEGMAFANAALHVADSIGGGWGPRLDGNVLLDEIGAHGGYAPGPVVGSSGGLAYVVAGHTFAWENRIRSEGNGTLADLDLANEIAREALERMRAAGLAGLRQEAVFQDVSWWHARASSEYSPQWEPLAKSLLAQARGSAHEAEIMTLAKNDSPFLGLLLFGLGFSAVICLGVVLLRRRRAISSAVMMAVLLVPASAADRLPADPDEVPVAFTEAEGVAALGNVVMDASGNLHFVWNQEVDGVYRIHHRLHDPSDGSWSPIRVMTHGEGQQVSPRLASVAGELHLVWANRPVDGGFESIIGHCVVVDHVCGDEQLLSQPGQQAFNLQVASSADSLWIVWRERPDILSGTAAIVARGWTPAGWTPSETLPVRVRGESPALVGDGQGGAFAAWFDVDEDHDDEPVVLRLAEWTHAGGPVVLERVTNQTGALALALAHRDDTVHVLHGTDPHGQGHLTLNHTVRRGGEWGPSHDVARSENGVQWPAIAWHGTDLVVVWVEASSVSGYRPHAARATAGVWASPVELLPNTAYDVLLPHILIDDQGIWHMVWSGKGPDVSHNQMHYMRARPEFEYAPPHIDATIPLSGSWLATWPPEVTIGYQSEVPLDPEQSWVRLNGQDVPWDFDINRVRAMLPEGAMGEHVFSVHLEDAAGGIADAAWTFGYDAHADEFHVDFTVVGSDEMAGPGWHSEPLRGTAVLRGGHAPAHVEGSIGAGPWVSVAEWDVAEGALWDMRFRSVDAAGNVLLGAPIVVGWDGTPPQVSIAPTVHVVGSDSLVHMETGVDESQHVGGAPGAMEVRTGAPVNIRVSMTHDDGRTHVLRTPLEPGNQFVAIPDWPDGAVSIVAVAIDGAGNQGQSHEWQILLDRTGPEMRLLNGDAPEVAVADHGSGLANVTVLHRGTIEHMAVQDGLARVALRGHGDWHVTASDAAGNIGQYKITLEPEGEPVIAEVQSIDEAPQSAQKAPLTALVATLMCLAVARSLRRSQSQSNGPMDVRGDKI